MSMVKNDNLLLENIVKTITWYNIFYFPLTAFELWENVGIKCGLLDVMNILDDERLKIHVETDNGFYFLRGRKELVDMRLARYNTADRKIKRAVRMTKLFKIFPWVVMVAVGNIMGAHNMREEGDIDFFIVTKKNRIWLTRFFLVSIVKFLGMRPKLGNLRDKICLSFFIDETSLNLSNFALGDGNDIYLKHWLANLVLIYDRNKTYEKLIAANDWIREDLPNWRETSVSQRRDAGKPFVISEKIFEALFGWTEKLFKKFQLLVLASELKSLMNKDSRVVINDRVLKLFPNDRRKEYRDEYLHKTRELKV